MNIFGNIVEIAIPPNNGHTVHIELPNGYSVEQVTITGLVNCFALYQGLEVVLGGTYTFPAINSCSPNSFNIFIRGPKIDAYISFVIGKFGQIPDEHYFEKPFEPIVVMGNDGKKYNVIPSDQFK